MRDMMRWTSLIAVSALAFACSKSPDKSTTRSSAALEALADDEPEMADDEDEDEPVVRGEQEPELDEAMDPDDPEPGSESPGQPVDPVDEPNPELDDGGAAPDAAPTARVAAEMVSAAEATSFVTGLRARISGASSPAAVAGWLFAKAGGYCLAYAYSGGEGDEDDEPQQELSCESGDRVVAFATMDVLGDIEGEASAGLSCGEGECVRLARDTEARIALRKVGGAIRVVGTFNGDPPEQRDDAQYDAALASWRAAIDARFGPATDTPPPAPPAEPPGARPAPSTTGR